MSETSRPIKDVVLGACILALSTTVYLESYRIKQIAFQDALGSAAFPRIMCVLSSVLGLIVIARAVLFRVVAGSDGPVVPALNADADHENTRRVVIVLTMTLVYVASLTLRFDFTVATSLFLFAMFVMMSEVSRRGLVIGAMVSLAIAITCSLLFTKLFLIDLPVNWL